MTNQYELKTLREEVYRIWDKVGDEIAFKSYDNITEGGLTRAIDSWIGDCDELPLRDFLEELRKCWD